MNGALRWLAAAALGLAVLVGAGTASAQIVNVQPLLKSAEPGFRGAVGGSLTWKTGNVDLLLTKGTVFLRYLQGAHLFLSSSRGELGIKNGDDFLERLFSHARWQWRLGDVVTWETYGQVASDRFKRLRLRGLAGTGPRFRLLDGEAGSLAVAVSYMFEHEQLGASDAADSERVENNHRLSMYVTGELKLDQRLSILHTTYFQPRLDAFIEDFRLLSETTLNVKLTSRLGLGVGFVLAYDSAPPMGVKPLDTATDVSLSLEL